MDKLELLAVLLNLTFLILIIFEKRVGWIFGIFGSLVSIFLFVQTNLFAEAFLYAVYVLIGIYGWWSWKNGGQELPVTTGGWRLSLFALPIGLLISVLVGNKLSTTASSYPYFDSVTTVFSLFASYLEAKKYLETWIYWIILNAATSYLYFLKGLSMYAILMVFYFIMSIIGFYQWNKTLIKS